MPQFYKLLRDPMINISKQWCAGNTNLTWLKQLFPFLLLGYWASSRGLEESSVFAGLQKTICSYKKIICSGQQNIFLHCQYGPWWEIQQVPTINDICNSLSSPHLVETYSLCLYRTASFVLIQKRNQQSIPSKGTRV